MFNINDKEILLYGFNEYCVEKEQFESATLTSYCRILEIYFENVVVNKITKNNYVELFDEKNLSHIKDIVKNNALRATFLNFLNFLKDEGFIEVDVEYYKIKERIEEILTGDNTKNEKNIDLLTPREIKNLFYSTISYNTKAEQKIAPLITALSFFCMYKQSDIFKLKIDDVDIENSTIRNNRYQETTNIAEYIKMNEKFHSIMVEYLEYRKTLNVDTDALIIFQNRPIEMQGINGMFGVYKRVGNRELVNMKKINCELLIRTVMHYLLISKGELGLITIFKLIRKENKDFQYAFNNYIDIKRNENLSDYIQMNTVDELLPMNRDEQLQQLKFSSKIHEDSVEEIDEDTDDFEFEFEELFQPYSANNDITFVDLEDFEMGNTRNQETTKVTIQRLVRDSSIARTLKEHYNYCCQLCNYQVRKSDGKFIVEAHHIKPYNKIHQGDDTTSNLLILCPNCHAQFDDLYFGINPETLLIHCIFEDDDYHLTELILKHKLGKEYLEYAWQLFNDKKLALSNIVNI